MSRDTQAARALLAYFNRPLVLRLVRHIMKESAPASRKKAMDTILEALPKATESVYSEVEKVVRDFGLKYLHTESFHKKMEDFVRINFDRWMVDSLNTAVKERATTFVKQYTSSYPMTEYMKTIIGRFQAEVEKEIQARAHNAVDEKMKVGHSG